MERKGGGCKRTCKARANQLAPVQACLDALLSSFESITAWARVSSRVALDRSVNSFHGPSRQEILASKTGDAHATEYACDLVNTLVKHRNVVNSSAKGIVGSEAAAVSTGELVRLLK
eukprot:scaffold7491_cov24-Tisochrysis_lutea.AAC.1